MGLVDLKRIPSLLLDWLATCTIGTLQGRRKRNSVAGVKPVVFFDFDRTLTVVHVFKCLAGWVDSQVCLLPMLGLMVADPHALTERGQLRRLAELGPAWIEQAFGGIVRVSALKCLLDGLNQSGCRIVLVTRGYVGVARKCLLEVGLLASFERVYGNVGEAYGTKTCYDDATEQEFRKVASSELWDLMGDWDDGQWDSKAEIVHRFKHMAGHRELFLFVDDDLNEIEMVRHAATPIHVQGNSGVTITDVQEILSLLGMEKLSWARSCLEHWRTLRDPLSCRPFAVTLFNRKHLPVRVSRYILLLEREFVERKVGIRRFALLLREPLLLWSFAQEAYVKHVCLKGHTSFTLQALEPIITGMQAQLGVPADDQFAFHRMSDADSAVEDGFFRVTSADAQPIVCRSSSLYERPSGRVSPKQPILTLTSMVRAFQDTLLGLCPITMSGAGLHRNSICCHDVCDLSVDDAVWARYDKVKHIGAGHFGQVFQVRELCSGEEVAIKQMERLEDGEECFGDEVSVLRALSHPNLLRVFEVIRFQGEVFIVTELAPGGTLSGYSTNNPRGEWIPGAMQQIVSAVAYCHRWHVLHGDLKPENVLVNGSRPDGSPLCIVCDFGHTTVCIGSVMVAAPGDPRYIAPEVILKEGLSAKSDVYMLGVISFELLTGGFLPFFGMQAVSFNIAYYQLGRGGVTELILSEDGLGWRDRNLLQVSANEETQKVVIAMLSRHAENRPNALDILQTDWIREAHKPCKSAYDAIGKGWGLWIPQEPSFASRLAQRSGLSWTYRKLLSLLGAGLSPKRIHGARLLFRRMDSVGDGTLTRAQFCNYAVDSGLTPEAADIFFSAGDLYNQRYLDFRSLVMMCLDLEDFSRKELLAELNSFLNRLLGPGMFLKCPQSPITRRSSSDFISVHGEAPSIPLETLKQVLQERSDHGMQIWVQNMHALLGPNVEELTGELLLDLLQEAKLSAVE